MSLVSLIGKYCTTRKLIHNVSILTLDVSLHTWCLCSLHARKWNENMKCCFVVKAKRRTSCVCNFFCGQKYDRTNQRTFLLVHIRNVYVLVQVDRRSQVSSNDRVLGYDVHLLNTKCTQIPFRLFQPKQAFEHCALKQVLQSVLRVSREIRAV